MFAGQIIQYEVTPLLGIPINWVTEITHLEKNKFFTDKQRFGPYTFWHHKHFLRSIPGGVEMEDIVDYKLLFGILWQMIHSIIVFPKLKKIFDYRRKALENIFRCYIDK